MIGNLIYTALAVCVVYLMWTTFVGAFVYVGHALNDERYDVKLGAFSWMIPLLFIAYADSYLALGVIIEDYLLFQAAAHFLLSDVPFSIKLFLCLRITALSYLTLGAFHALFTKLS